MLVLTAGSASFRVPHCPRGYEHERVDCVSFCPLAHAHSHGITQKKADAASLAMRGLGAVMETEFVLVALVGASRLAKVEANEAGDGKGKSDGE